MEYSKKEIEEAIESFRKKLKVANLTSLLSGSKNLHSGVVYMNNGKVVSAEVNIFDGNKNLESVTTSSPSEPTIDTLPKITKIQQLLKQAKEKNPAQILEKFVGDITKVIEDDSYLKQQFSLDLANKDLVSEYKDIFELLSFKMSEYESYLKDLALKQTEAIEVKSDKLPNVVYKRYGKYDMEKRKDLALIIKCSTRTINNYCREAGDKVESVKGGAVNAIDFAKWLKVEKTEAYGFFIEHCKNQT